MLAVVAAPRAGAAPVSPPAPDSSPAPVDAAVWEQLSTGSATFLVRIRGPLPWERGAGTIQLTPETILASGRHRVRLLSDTLQELERAGHVTRTEAFPASRVVAVDGDIAAVRALAADPAVEEVRPDGVRIVPDARIGAADGDTAGRAGAHPVRGSGGDSVSSVAPQLGPIRAAEAWSRLGVTGEGTVIAVLDTGVDWTHPALLPRYRGRDGDHNYDWFDATGAGSDVPADNNGHGTFVAGLAVGSDPVVQTGVAPGAEWVAVKAFDRTGRGRDSWLLRAAEWVLAPTDRYGARARPDLAPDIVNASWVLNNGVDPLLAPAVAAWRAAGIVPVFAAGNDESGIGQSGTVLAPASYPVSIGVGATMGSAIWNLSMGGPSFYGGMSPLLLAPIPGQSTTPGGGFGIGLGTSAAAPLVSGTAALMLAAQPELTPDDVARALAASARDMGPSGPDPLHGYGQLDAYEALRRALFSGRARGMVALADGTPVDALMTFRRADDQEQVTLDAPTGAFDVALTEGEWDVTFEGFGVATGSARFFVEPAVTTRIDLTANPGTVVTVTGRVRDELGRPIRGAIVERTDSMTRAETDGQGTYTLPLTEGRHSLTASLGGRRTVTAELEIYSGAGPEAAGPGFELPVAPSIAVVDADADLEERIYPYIEHSLDQLGFASTSWAMGPEAGEAWPPLSADVVVWAHHTGSPGRLDQRQGQWVTDALEAYVRGGGRLLLAGQNVAELDAGSGPVPAAPEFVRDVLRASYVWGNAGAVPAIGRGPLAGAAVQLDSADGYRWWSALSPDAVAPSDAEGDPAEVAMVYPDGLAAGIAAAGELGRRLYLAFALHGAGPETERARLVDGALGWLAAPDVVLQLDPPQPRPGQSATLTIWVFGGHADASAALRVQLPSALALTAAGGGLEPVPGGAAWTGRLASQPRSFAIETLVMPTSGAIDLEVDAELIADRQPVTRRLVFRADASGFESSTLGVSPDRLHAGEEAVTSFVIANSGSLAGPVDATFGVGQGLALAPESVTATRGDARVEGDTVRWAGEVAPGAAVTVTARVRADGSVARPLLTASLTGPAGSIDTPPPDLLVGGPELISTLRLSSQEVTVGGQVTATLDITNAGSERAEASARLSAPAGFAVSGSNQWYGVVEAGSRAIAAWTLHVVTATMGSAAVLTEVSDGLRPDHPSTAQAELTIHSPDLEGSSARFLPAEALSAEILWGEVNLTNNGDAPADSSTTVTLPPGLTTSSQWITTTEGTVSTSPGGLEWRTSVPPGGQGASLRYGALVGRSVAANTHVAVPHTVTHDGGTQVLTAHALLNGVSLSQSTLEARPPARMAGGRTDYVLTVRATGAAGASDVRAEIHVPPTLSILDGTLTGGLTGGGMSTLVWRGEIGAGEERVMGWSGVLGEDLIPGSQAIVLARVQAEGVPPVHLGSRVEITNADLTGSTKSMRPAVASRGDLISIVLRAVNGGPEATDTSVTDALPAGLVFAEGSLTASHGAADWDPASRSVRWTGEIGGSEAVEVRFYAEYDSDGEVRNVMVVADDVGTRMSSWAVVSPIRARLYMPRVAHP